MLHYEVCSNTNTNRWLVFLHGAGGSIKTWSYQQQHFAPHFNLLLIDLRDHGRSKSVVPAYEQYTFALISADIKQVLDQVGVSQASFLSLSFGSVLIQDFYLRYPSRVEKVVIAGGIFRGNLAIKSFVKLAQGLNLVLSYETMYNLFSYLLMPRKRNQKARRIYKLQAAKLTPTEYMKWVGLYGEFFRLLHQFYHQQINVPMLIVMGGDDYIFLRAARKFSKRSLTTTLSVLPKVGHIVNIEAAQDFNTLVLDFLKVRT